MNDLELLRQHEPILRFTQGELFFPTSAEQYVARCSLWVAKPNQESELLVEAGKLNLELLAEYGEVLQDRPLYLRFVQEPLSRIEYERWARRPDLPVFQSRGRLARVGLGPRIIDAAFALSLFLRGTVPGGTTAAAALQYDEIRAECPGHIYYGRVVRDGGYIVLQYLFFYVMNDWRSSFHGANDHEADWEQILIYLEDRGEEPPEPAWVAFSAHGHSGDELRRRWDDPDIAREGTHPVVFVSAGSHASYFMQGEYLTRVEVAFLRPLMRVVSTLDRVWRNLLQQGDRRSGLRAIESILSVPFVEYARGDGLAIGPGMPETWTPILLQECDGWVEHYRGLWGLDTRDPFPAERAPTGPKYLPGGVRSTWHDPLGWVGLNKITPPGAAARLLKERIDELRIEREQIDGQVAEQRGAVRRLELEIRSLRDAGYPTAFFEERQARLTEQDRELRAILRRRAVVLEAITASQRQLQRVLRGDQGDPQGHLRHSMRPETERNLRQRRLAEIWSAASVGLLLLGIVLLVLPGIASWFLAIVATVGLFVLIEATFHRHLQRLLLNLTIALTLVTTAILVYEFYAYIIPALLIGLAMLLITDNLRELRRR